MAQTLQSQRALSHRFPGEEKGKGGKCEVSVRLRASRLVGPVVWSLYIGQNQHVSKF